MKPKFGAELIASTLYSSNTHFGISNTEEPKFGVGIIADECNDSVKRMLLTKFKKKYLDPHNMILGSSQVITKQKLANNMDDIVAGYERYDACANKQDTSMLLLTAIWPALAWIEISADFVIFGPIEDPILKRVKELILFSAPTFETIFYNEFTLAIVHRKKVCKFLKLPVLSNDEIEDICRYDLSTFSHTEGLKELTAHGKTVENDRIYKLKMSMIATGCTSDEIVRVQKYCRVILDAIKYRLDYKKAKQELGISELMKKYEVGSKEVKKNG